MTLLCSTLLCCAHQVSILQLLEPLLNRDHGANAARYADLQHFAAAIVRRFVATAKTNPNLFIEALFWKKYSVCVQLAIGYELAIASRWPLSFLPCNVWLRCKRSTPALPKRRTKKRSEAKATTDVAAQPPPIITTAATELPAGDEPQDLHA